MEVRASYEITGKANKMKTIVIEGLDKSGKHTQSDMLVEYLRSKGYKVAKSEFHRYDTPTGKLIQDWLYGKYDVDQLTIELIMTADKQAQQKWFDELEKDGYDFLVLDRYVTSQLVYSMANGVDIDWTLYLQKFMRVPSLEIFIDITAEESIIRKGKWGDNDKYESNIKMLNEVRALYYTYIKNIINGMQSIEDVHKDIVEVVDKLCLK